LEAFALGSDEEGGRGESCLKCDPFEIGQELGEKGLLVIELVGYRHRVAQVGSPIFAS
jgi:hypothetical protein